MLEAEFCVPDGTVADGEAGGTTQGICGTDGTQVSAASRDLKRIQDECGLGAGLSRKSSL